LSNIEGRFEPGFPIWTSVSRIICFSGPRQQRICHQLILLQNKILDEAANAFEKEIPELQKALTEKLRGLLAPTAEEIPQIPQD